MTAASDSRREPAFTFDTRLLLPAGTILILIAFLFPMPFLSPNVSFGFYLMLWITMASGLNIMAGYTGYMPFGYVAFYGIGSYVTGILVRMVGLKIELALAGAALAGIVLSLIFAPALRLRGIYFAIVSLAFAIICKLVISNLPPEVAGGSFGITLGINDPLATFYAMLALMTGTLVAVTVLSRSRLGTELRAIRDDWEAASVMGIDVPRARLKAWILSTMVAALCGGLEAWYSNAIDTESAFNMLISTKSIIYAILGGLGTVVGPVIGTVVMVSLDDLIWRHFPVLNTMLLGIVIVALMLFAPRGILGTLFRRYPQVRRFVS